MSAWKNNFDFVWPVKRQVSATKPHAGGSNILVNSICGFADYNTTAVVTGYFKWVCFPK